MVFAAGLGTRLRPYTNDRPKALVEVGGIPLLDIHLRRLKYFGFEEVVVNVHHFADMMERHLAGQDYGLTVHVSDERDELLETGGGLQRAAHFFPGEDPVFICNVDVLSNLNPLELLDVHSRNGALATLALRERVSDRYLVVDGGLRVCGWKNEKTGETKGEVAGDGRALAFSGQHVVSPELFRLMRQTGAFSIIETYLDLAGTGRVLGYVDESSVWMDVGKPRELEAAGGVLGKVLLG
jgi:N-acetyl-alpha-D-muramate 1-phosphate uridylyltransferase